MKGSSSNIRFFFGACFAVALSAYVGHYLTAQHYQQELQALQGANQQLQGKLAVVERNAGKSPARKQSRTGFGRSANTAAENDSPVAHTQAQLAAVYEAIAERKVLPVSP